MKREFSVRLPQRDTAAAQRIDVVRADYVALQNGHLCFRNQTLGSYPDTVRVYAPGAWLEFEALTEPVQPTPRPRLPDGHGSWRPDFDQPIEGYG